MLHVLCFFVLSHYKFLELIDEQDNKDWTKYTKQAKNDKEDEG